MIQEWFLNAKFGIFIHWGIYAVGEREASWAFYNYDTPVGRAKPEEHVDHETYMKQAEQFTAGKYEPREWARMFKEAGATYAVLTTKHHDGVALWDTAANDLSVVKKTPAGRDLVGPFVDAMREVGLKVGLYFSHPDWTHPDFASVWNGDTPHEVVDEGARRFVYPIHRRGGRADENAWQRFLQFHRAQILELATCYRPDLFWFDGGFERTPAQWRFPQLAAEIRALLPEIVINDRFGGCGDYKTPEQGLPLWPIEGPWEFCMTMNHQWGYSFDQSQYKPPHQLTRTLAEVAGMGGNLLLNVGPREDGTVPEKSREGLSQIGQWVRENRAAFFGTRRGLLAGYAGHATTLSDDRRTVYVFVFDRPWHDLPIKGIRNKIRRIRVLGDSAAPRDLPFRVIGGAPWHNVPGVVWVDTAGVAWNPLGTVLAAELEGELDLYQPTGAGNS